MAPCGQTRLQQQLHPNFLRRGVAIQAPNAPMPLCPYAPMPSLIIFCDTFLILPYQCTERGADIPAGGSGSALPALGRQVECEGDDDAELDTAGERLNAVYERLQEVGSATAEARAAKILHGLGAPLRGASRGKVCTEEYSAFGLCPSGGT